MNITVDVHLFEMVKLFYTGDYSLNYGTHDLESYTVDKELYKDAVLDFYKNVCGTGILIVQEDFRVTLYRMMWDKDEVMFSSWIKPYPNTVGKFEFMI